ncbi:hypothetical protein ACJX0J_008491, partial [Zea mays]
LNQPVNLFVKPILLDYLVFHMRKNLAGKTKYGKAACIVLLLKNKSLFFIITFTALYSLFISATQQTILPQFIVSVNDKYLYLYETMSNQIVKCESNIKCYTKFLWIKVLNMNLA